MSEHDEHERERPAPPDGFEPPADDLRRGEQRAEEPTPAAPEEFEPPTDPAGAQPRVDRAKLVPGDPLVLRRAIGPGGRAGAGAEAPRSGSLFAPAAERDDEGVDVVSEPLHRDAPQAARFQFLLGALLAVAIVAIVALVYVVGNGGAGSSSASSWSPWKPSAGGATGAQEIADHVGPQYRLGTGEQLVLVTGGKLEVADLPLRIAVRDAAGDVRLSDGNGVLYRLCGLGPKCAIAKGKPSQARHLLLRREALELALYSFRYLKGVDQVVVFMPPRPGADPDQALFFRRGDVDGPLHAPLRATLPVPAPTVKTVTRERDSSFINRLTTGSLFTFSLTQANQDASVFLVLEPFDLTAGSSSGTVTPSTGSSSGGGSSSSSSGSSASSSGKKTATHTTTKKKGG